MKSLRMFLSAFAVLAIVGGALAFTPKSFGGGNVFCEPTGTLDEACPGTAINFEVSTTGQSDPCTSGVAHINQGAQCVNVPEGSLFQETPPGK